MMLCSDAYGYTFWVVDLCGLLWDGCSDGVVGSVEAACQRHHDPKGQLL